MTAEILRRVPVVDGLFRQLAPPRLLGTCCERCGSYYFPRTVHCRNPHCGGAQAAEVVLSDRGRLYSFTVQHYRPPPPFLMEPWVPYALGLLELREGLRILGMIVGIPFAELRIGMELEVSAGPLRRNADGQEVLTYQFVHAEVVRA